MLFEPETYDEEKTKIKENPKKKELAPTPFLRYTRRQVNMARTRFG